MTSEGPGTLITDLDMPGEDRAPPGQTDSNDVSGGVMTLMTHNLTGQEKMSVDAYVSMSLLDHRLMTHH